jgi:hypothetical protein
LTPAVIRDAATFTQKLKNFPRGRFTAFFPQIQGS